jgi:histidinol dehydrogenase
VKARRVEWTRAAPTAAAIRGQIATAEPEGLREAVAEIGEQVRGDGDAALARLGARFDRVDVGPEGLRVDPAEATRALAATDTGLREAMEVSAVNIEAVAAAQVDDAPRTVELAQGQSVTIREVPVGAAGVYAPGGRAAYASSVLMCAIPARVAGVSRLALASPPGPNGRLSPAVLAAAALCEVEEIFAVGGAQAIFGLAYGTETLSRVDVVVGPGSAWVQEAKRTVNGLVGIDSYAGPSELMVVAGHDADAEWIALDLCAQAEHGEDSPLLVAAVEERVLDAVETAVEEAAGSRPSVHDVPLFLVQVPDAEAAIDLANAYAPEHLELVEEDAARLAERITTAGCVFVGRNAATALGDYVAGSNHVLPTGGAGRFSGPLGPGAFRRKIATVEVPPDAAARLAPYADAIARAEGLPVHGESAMIRSKEGA